MLFKVSNKELVRDRERTFLTAVIAAAGTTATVKAVDTNAWADNDYIIIGEIGTENAEVLQVNGAVSDGTSLTIDNNGSGGARYAHSIGEPVYRIDYNRVEFSRNTTDTSSGVSVLATNEIQADDEFTRYQDTANTTGYGFVRFNNQTATTFSPYSDGVPYTGYTPRSLGRMIRIVRKRLGGKEATKHIEDDEIRDEINEKQRDIAHERLWPFYEDTFSLSSVAYQRDYDVDSDVVIGKPHTVTFRSEPLAKVDAVRFDTFFWDSAVTGEPTYASVWNNQIRVYPVPSSAADTDQLNGALTATATTVTVDSTSGFAPSGRIIIDSEVIAYTNISSTAFRGCTRGLEETTAASHSDDAAVTERDIIYTANREPNELVDIQDETSIPDPDVLINGAAFELATEGIGDKGLSDRLKERFDNGLSRLRDKFGQKFTQSFYNIKNKEEVATDNNRLRNPNDYPTIT